MSGRDSFEGLPEPEPPGSPRMRENVPGLAVTVFTTLAAAWVSDHYGAPLTLMCLLFGLALNFLSTDERLAPGLAMASRTLLRWGIVFVAARVTLTQIVQLGPVALLAVVAIVAVTLGSGVLVARRLGFSPAFGVLGGGAVAICGASAAMAFASLLGEKRVSQAQLTLVLVGISAMSALAMTLYPLIARGLELNDIQAGFMLGAAIHDVAQSLGAGYSFSQTAGETAAIVKLTRVALLAPSMMVVALFLPRSGEGRMVGSVLPWFVVGFFGLAAINSFGLVPAFAATASEKAATALLACAVTATGIRSRMQSLMGHGVRPLLVIVIATLVALVASALAANFLIR